MQKFALARAATTGTGDLGSVVGHLAVIVAYAVVGVLWGRRTFAKRLTA